MMHSSVRSISTLLITKSESKTRSLFTASSFIKLNRNTISSQNINFIVQSSPLLKNVGSITHLSSFPPNRPNNNRYGVLGAVGASGLLLFSKGKYVLGALKLTKFASLGSMLVSIGAYSMVFGLPYAVGMVGQLVLHESGHALAMRHYNIPFSPMLFIPFVGASVAMNQSPRSAYQEAIIAIGGPSLGALGAFGISLGAYGMDSQLGYALADFGYMINLFNLLPIGMLDGGKITAALSKYTGVVGLGIGGAMIYSGIISNPIFYLVMLSGGYSTFMRFYDPYNVPLNYYNITQAQRLQLTGGYFGLIGLLVTGMSLNNEFKKTPSQIQYEQDLHKEKLWDDTRF